MPGGRLTDQDRRDIAAGLAEGLTYAEIARRMERPTSTVSREVTRNGGPGDYRAERARRATAHRARRTKPPASATSQDALDALDTPDAQGRDAASVREFEERFTALLVQQGLSRMTARILTCLYMTDTGALTSAEFVRRLRVSPASVSKSIAYLESQELVRREREGGRRPERYLIDDDVWYRAWLASARTNAMLADVAREGAAILGEGTPAGTRLSDVGRFLHHANEDAFAAAEHWRQVIARERTATARTPERPRAT
ncbi:MarR family transcriptional regulator [Streptomyces sp. NPDC059009]|uniref:MarR family transcriptional regulator n=1 Tax=Streptomyces sp. NPDC059009 TaxID=3346694 RepID=UPI003684C6F5